MSLPEATGPERLPRPATVDAQQPNDVHGVQATGWGAIAPAGVPYPEVAGDGLPGGEGQCSSDIRALLDGFASAAWKPHPYQYRGIDWLTHRISGALFLAPGLGKTSITLAAILKLQAEGLAQRVLVFAPLTVCITTWDTEPKKWLQFQELKIGFAHGPDRLKVIKDPKYDIVLVNYDGLAWLAPVLAKSHHFDVVVYDELTKLKHTTSKRFKLLKGLLPTFKFKWGLTASPTANGYMDLFGEIYVLDCGQRLGRYITHFRSKYFYQQPWDQYNYYITPEKAEQLTAQIADVAMYLDPKDHLTLPALLTIERPVLLSDFAKYKFLQDEYILQLKDTVITAANAGVLTSKLRQYTGGALYIEDGSCEVIHTDKLEALKALIEELNGEPLIIAYEFNHECERLLAALPGAQAIRGGLSVAETQKIVAAWNAGELPFLLIQPQAGAHGLNLQEGGAAICWYSLTYNLELYEQLIARIYRQGQRRVVRNYLLIARNTIDETMAKILAKKGTSQSTMFAALKKFVTDGVQTAKIAL